MSDFILPDIGEGIVECELVKWLVSEGDVIEEDQPVVEVMTDKALVEIPAPSSGKVTRLYYKEGEIAKVHAPLFALVEGGDSATETQNEESSKPAPVAEPESRAEPKNRDNVSTGPSASSPEPSAERSRVPASPAVRRLVREHGVNLSDIPGSGKDGRVLKADVLAHLEATDDVPSDATAASSASRARTFEQQGDIRVEPIKGMKAAMARAMLRSATTIPHFIYSEDIDVTDLLALREQLKPEAEARGHRLTLMPFFMKAMALAIRDYPVLNSRLNDDVTEIHYLPHVNIGMAVDGAAGLVVPNVKNVDRLTLLGVAEEVSRLTEAARAGRVSPDDLKGGTITISNIGALGGTYAAPIINAPEVAIVALGRVQKLPRFNAKGKVVERAILTVSWAGDHRIIDGGTIARFCNAWKGYLESPQSMLLHLG
ncbi:MAG: dihydrolipoamide acetyltransferase [Marinobacter sp. 34-60-7]|nr:MAG: dihydrolipoamide acetyltransferase [Marinobacter sp. 34-60-7]